MVQGMGPFPGAAAAGYPPAQALGAATDSLSMQVVKGAAGGGGVGGGGGGGLVDHPLSSLKQQQDQLSHQQQQHHAQQQHQQQQQAVAAAAAAQLASSQSLRNVSVVLFLIPLFENNRNLQISTFIFFHFFCRLSVSTAPQHQY